MCDELEMSGHWDGSAGAYAVGRIHIYIYVVCIIMKIIIIVIIKIIINKTIIIEPLPDPKDNLSPMCACMCAYAHM